VKEDLAATVFALAARVGELEAQIKRDMCPHVIEAREAVHGREVRARMAAEAAANHLRENPLDIVPNVYVTCAPRSSGEPHYPGRIVEAGNGPSTFVLGPRRNSSGTVVGHTFEICETQTVPYVAAEFAELIDARAELFIPELTQMIADGKIKVTPATAEQNRALAEERRSNVMLAVHSGRNVQGAIEAAAYAADVAAGRV
jgi:hypothetical protein